METPENPFVVKGYISPNYFCNRNKEVKKIKSAFTNGRNCTLFSVRKMGKTGTISHLFHQNKADISAYVEIFSTQNLAQFANTLGKVVLPKIETQPRKLIRWVGHLFSGIRPSIQFDPVSGQPSLELGIRNEDQAFRSLEEIFNGIKNWGGSLWLALDEFQQITQYPEKGTEAHLRSILQFCPNVKAIFSGSQRQLLTGMFTDYGRPFYQSTDIMELRQLDKSEYLDFIRHHFEAGKRQFEPEVISDWLDRLHLHTYYVQLAMNRLYAAKPKKWKTRDFELFFHDLLLDRQPVYESIYQLLTHLQWRLLEAIALEGRVAKPSGKDWLMKYKLGSASSVQAALAAMEQREMVVPEESGYRLMDPFMEHWFKQVYSVNAIF